MKFLRQIFNLIWNGLSSFWAFLSSIAGVFTAAIVGLVTSFMALLNSLLSAGGTLCSAITGFVNPLVSDLSTFLAGQSGFLSFCSYSLALDVLCNCMLLIATFGFLLVATFATFWLVAVPAWFVAWFAFRATVWLMTVLFPSSWLPSGFSSLGALRMSQ